MILLVAIAELTVTAIAFDVSTLTLELTTRLYQVEAAKAAGAIPVLVTPVSRVYYNADGTIKSHHDSTDSTTGTYVSSNDAYVTAVKQLGAEQNVLVIDAFQLTKDMYEAAYKADSSASNGVSAYGKQVMSSGDSTHSNKSAQIIDSFTFVSNNNF